MKPEIIDIFNERMELIGTESRKNAHLNGNWHKVFHCWIVGTDSKGKGFVLFQLRSKTKDTVPNSLDISAAGHLHIGETPIQGLRELKEELGITIKEEKLHFLGIHVEVWCDSKTINREFDFVYLINENKELNEYKVQPSEVSGLTKIYIEDGINLFSNKIKDIKGESLMFNDLGFPDGTAFEQNLTVEAFAGGYRNNYFIKILLLAERFLQGDRLLYI